MPFDPIYIVYGLVILALILLLEGAFSLVITRADQSGAINKRLKLLAGGKTRKEIVALLQRQNTPYHWDPTGILTRYNHLLEQAGIKSWSVERVLLTNFLITIFTIVICRFFTLPWVQTIVVSLIVGVLFPLLVVLKKRNNRLKRFGAQLPDAIDVMIRSLRAGHPIPSSVALVAKEMNDPIGTEFGICSDEMTFGQDLYESLMNMSKRIGHPDLQFFVVAVGIQRQVGGNLAEVLENLSKVIRERFQMKAKVRAISAEGRASAWLLSLLPFILFGIINLIAPSFYADVWEDPIFMPVISGGILLAIIGDFIMYRMVNFKF